MRGLMGLVEEFTFDSYNNKAKLIKRHKKREGYRQYPPLFWKKRQKNGLRMSG
jgi:hypothetical protein